mmetsp:Transcript_21161/g.36101  ORF Transcript_21161/g.36101 Transcript_21161/m.36101 type:complete len:82 (-) Transcript_21161:80-325(-)
MTPTLDLASQMFPNLSGISVEGTIWKSSNTPDGTYVLVPPVLTESFNGYHIGFGAAATLSNRGRRHLEETGLLAPVLHPGM